MRKLDIEVGVGVGIPVALFIAGAVLVPPGTVGGSPLFEDEEDEVGIENVTPCLPGG